MFAKPDRLVPCLSFTKRNNFFNMLQICAFLKSFSLGQMIRKLNMIFFSNLKQIAVRSTS